MYIDASKQDMSEQHRQVASCHRKLPTIPHHRRHSGCWPAYKTAVDWMQHHKDVVETALALVELHPRLIQNKVCDKLYDFVSCVTFGMDSSARDHLTPAYPFDNLREQCHMKIKEEPTHFKSNKTDKSVNKGAVKYIFVCGMFSGDKWTRILMDLCKRYFIMCTEQDQEHDWTFGMSRADVVLFLLDDDSKCDTNCLKQFETALSWDKSVIFIRDETLTRQKMKDKLDITLAKTSDSNLKDLGHTNEVTHTWCCTKNNNEIMCDDVKNRPQKSDNIQPCHRIPDLCRLHEIITNKVDGGSDQMRASKKVIGCSEASIVSHSLAISLKLRKAMDDGYSQSLVYQKHQHVEFMTTLHPVISKQYAGKNSESSRLFGHHKNQVIYDSNVDTGVCACEENKHSLRAPEPETYAKDENKDDILFDEDNEISNQETIFLIYAKDDIAQGSPKVVHWPSDLKEGGNMSHSPSIDSFGFEDVDLSKSVNNLDIFSKSDSD